MTSSLQSRVLALVGAGVFLAVVVLSALSRSCCRSIVKSSTTMSGWRPASHVRSHVRWITICG
jgi:hypothetical protein